jgi:hypothetical protein
MRLCATRYLQRGGWRTESIIDGAGSGPRPSSLSTEDDCFRSVGLAGLCVAASSGVRERFRSLIHQARLRQTRSAHYYFVHRAHGRLCHSPIRSRAHDTKLRRRRHAVFPILSRLAGTALLSVLALLAGRTSVAFIALRTRAAGDNQGQCQSASENKKLGISNPASCMRVRKRRVLRIVPRGGGGPPQARWRQSTGTSARNPRTHRRFHRVVQGLLRWAPGPGPLVRSFWLPKFLAEILGRH